MQVFWGPLSFVTAALIAYDHPLRYPLQLIVSLGQFYGDRLHEGHYFDPALRDIEALLTSSQRRVTGETRIRCAPGRFQVTGVRSPHSMMDPSVATYGEEHTLWTGEEARGFARVGAIPSLLAARAEVPR